MALITVSNLSIGYDSREILKDLDFQIHMGDYLCIVGENGSGKTTLMKTFLGLRDPIDGQILFGDGLHPNEIGYLPQQTLIQSDFPASVKEIVLSGCLGHSKNRIFYTKEERLLADKNIKKMGISHLKNQSFSTLSGGQKQRVLLARALCATKKIILLDEPVAGLDPRVTSDMYKLIHDLNKQGITIIMISHDVGCALKYASHILHIGGNTFFGTKKEYLQSNVGRIFLAEQEEYARNA